MPTIHDPPPAGVQTDLNRLAQALNTAFPTKSDTNLLIATWKIRRFGSLTRKWIAMDTMKKNPWFGVSRPILRLAMAIFCFYKTQEKDTRIGFWARVSFMFGL